uniref:Uncharacterized protein n=1 Tax=Trichuris muris TaxID=70415 RepID=A0A5S6PYT9_TRIMR
MPTLSDAVASSLRRHELNSRGGYSPLPGRPVGESPKQRDTTTNCRCELSTCANGNKSSSGVQKRRQYAQRILRRLLPLRPTVAQRNRPAHLEMPLAKSEQRFGAVPLFAVGRGSSAPARLQSVALTKNEQTVCAGTVPLTHVTVSLGRFDVARRSPVRLVFSFGKAKTRATLAAVANCRPGRSSQGAARTKRPFAGLPYFTIWPLESVRRSSLPKRASSQFRQMRVACSSEELFIDRAFPLRSLRCFVLR